MIRSMTAFARRTSRHDWGELVWEVRAVNHRYLETGFRLPEDLRSLETPGRKTVAKRLRRGKVDCSLRVRFEDAATTAIALNERLLDNLIERVTEIGGRLPRAAAPDSVDLLHWPGVVAEAERDLGPVEAAALGLLDETLAALAQARTAEGARIRDMLLERCAGIEAQVAAVRARLPEVRRHIRDKLTGRIAELGLEPDRERLEQELVLIAQKMDVDEELDRLESHVTETRTILERSDAVGRRLDFLMQEFNREANTLSSKSNDAETTRAAVAIKVLVEQMREQVQNVE